MSATFVVYVDESGDEGFNFDAGSSEWFVLTAVVVHKAEDLEVCRLVDAVREDLGRVPKSPLHFRDLKHEQRLPYIARIAAANLRLVSVFVHKRSLAAPETFRKESRLYFYAVRYLLERVSWYCRDHKTQRDIGDGSAEVIFSNRSGMSYDDLRDYLRWLRFQSKAADVRVDWTVIKPDQVIPYPPAKRMGLLIADAAAGSFFYAVQPSRYGFTEDRFARMLKPVVYHRQLKYRGYGLKFWPREVEPKLETEPRFGWLREIYK